MMEPTLDVLRASIQLACRPQNAGRIITEEQVVALPRVWVLERIERVATETLDLADYWEYRRLLELADLLDFAWYNGWCSLAWPTATRTCRRPLRTSKPIWPNMALEQSRDGL